MSARRLPFARNERGLALVEFAIVAPILLLLYLGGWQLSDALACKRKVTITARAVTDLTTQYASLAPGQTTTILNAAAQTMTPYSFANYGGNVSELYTDNNGVTTVVWSCANGLGSPFTRNSYYQLPAGMASNNTYLILGLSRYVYRPLVAIGITGPFVMGENIYMSPRLSSSISGPEITGC